MNWETVIGLEVHAELSTKTKIFCACSASFGAPPNTHVCPVCSGMPGTLPKLNRTAVEYALRLGLALGCEITLKSRFDRKNYFYPDLPKAYQVSQLYAPICRGGYVTITAGGQEKMIRIREIHLEEDAGKLIHDTVEGGTLMDFNRCGVPLVEIVSEPDLRTVEEAFAYLEKLRETLLFLGVCDCKMQEGSIRADINLSVRENGGDMGVRTEMKNMNSFKAIGRAIASERERQLEILRKGGKITQETRRWDDAIGSSQGMRSKENAQDYRYFPEPDLLPVEIDDAWLVRVREGLPELAHEKRSRYREAFGLGEPEAAVLTSHKKISDLFESVAGLSGEPREAANLICGEVMRLINQTGTLPENLSIDPAKLSVLISLVLSGRINRGAYKEALEAVFTLDAEPEAYISEKGLFTISNEADVTAAVRAALAENPKSVSDYRAGKEKALGFLIGSAMRLLCGAGDPDAVRKTLLRELEGGEK